MGKVGSKTVELNTESETESELEGTLNSSQEKILLLGSGKCGKTSIFKQFRLRFGNQYDLIDEVDRIRKALFLDLQDSMKIIKNMYGDVAEDETLNNDLIRAFPKTLNYDYSQSENPLLFQKRVSALKRLIETKRFKLFLSKELLICHISDGFIYFVNNFDRVFGEKYIPTTEDYLRCDITTAGIEETVFQYKKMNCMVVDTGGQRAERTKWPNTFQNVSAVVFVASLADFNHTLFEDNDVNCLQETITLFKRACRILALREVQVFLLFTKVDILQEKLKQFEKLDLDLDIFFPDLKLGKNYKNAFEKIEQHITDLVIGDADFTKRDLTVHYVCGIDTRSVEITLKRILDKVYNTTKS